MFMIPERDRKSNLFLKCLPCPEVGFKTKGKAWGFQHVWRDLVNFDSLKKGLILIIVSI